MPYTIGQYENNTATPYIRTILERKLVETHRECALRFFTTNVKRKAGLSYYNPHAFRNTLVKIAYELCKTPEEFKAWSQNLGHNSPLTTFVSYGQIEAYNQGEIIKRLGNGKF